jgi:hypothetical protein
VHFPVRIGFVIAVTMWLMPVAGASSSIYMPVERVAAIAPLIVEGTVVRVASGFDPLTTALSTYVTVDLSYVHRGPADLERVIVREPGGRFGDLIHAVDAVPVFHPGERVLLFLEPARDRSLRVAGMFFGKLELVEGALGAGRIARRELSGQGLIVGRESAEAEEFPAAEIESVIASFPYERSNGPRPKGSPRGFLAVPPEFGRLSWDDVREAAGGKTALRGAAPAIDFVSMSSTYPARWNEVDASSPIAINIQPGGNPLNDNAAAVDAMKRAMAAWTQVPEARIVLQSGNEDYNFTVANAQSPAVAYPPANIILFNDPYNEITDPSGCSGTLAIGGYWRSGSGAKIVNGVTFFPILRQYVIFNNNFQCFLGNADNLAEVATHELGHGIGFGHSAVADAIMRSSAYGNGRGPRLGDDDRDGAHCEYPHALIVTSPNGGESWSGGGTHSITWGVTGEAGPDPGTVDIEYSADAGLTWSALSTAEPNDGSYAWTIASNPSGQSSVRVVRHNRTVPTPAPFPEACSKDASDASFTVVSGAAAPVAGTAPDGSSGAPLHLDKAAGGNLTLTWGLSCSGSASDYAIYEGTLQALRLGTWDHVPKTCSAGADLTETIVPGALDGYYLIAPMAAAREGLLGRSSTAVERPPSTSACAPREATSCP